MSAAPARPARPGAATAISAFLHGIERRARVLARAQAGDMAAGDRALAEATSTFLADAAHRPLAQWPQRFWSTLLATAPLRAPAAGASGWHALAPGPRAALLLRWAGGLDDATAAQVLGVSPATFRLALRHALDAAGDGAPALQAEIDARLATPDAEPVPMREPIQADADVSAPARPRALLAVLWSLLVACVLAFAATFVPASDTSRAPTRPVPLPDSTPAARYDAAAAVVVHRDFALLVDADAAPWLEDLEFHAWLAAGAPAPTDASGVEAPVPGLVPIAPISELETHDAPL